MITKTKTFCRLAKFSLLSLCGIAALSALPQRASAALDAHGNVTFNATATTAGVFATRYNHAVADIRGRVANGSIYDNVFREMETRRYFTVHVDFNHGVNERLGLVFRTDNMYIVGFYNPRNNTYYRIGTGGPAVPMGYPAAFTAAQISNIRVNQHDFPSEAYSDLQNLANRRRDEVGINQATFQESARSLLGNGNIDTRARGVLFFAQAFAEAARFHYISYRVERALRQGTTYTISPTAMALENHWGDLSTNLLDILAGGQPSQQIPLPALPSPQVQISLNTAQRIAAQLALCLMTQNSRRHLNAKPGGSRFLHPPAGTKRPIPPRNSHSHRALIPINHGSRGH